MTYVSSQRSQVYLHVRDECRCRCGPKVPICLWMPDGDDLEREAGSQFDFPWRIPYWCAGCRTIGIAYLETQELLAIFDRNGMERMNRSDSGLCAHIRNREVSDWIHEKTDPNHIFRLVRCSNRHCRRVYRWYEGGEHEVSV